MIIVDMRAAAIDAIQAVFPKAALHAHAGRFNLADIRRLATKTPAICVAVLGMPRTQDAGNDQADHELRMAAFVLTSDKGNLKRDVAALNIVESLAILIPGKRWGMAGVHPAERVTGESLYSAEIDKIGLCLWAVTWSQRIRLDQNAYPNGPVLALEEDYVGPPEGIDYVGDAL